ncbi:MAG: hypothetical protein EAX96_10240 [Candidatus Lokiarchaeota archaeon]|nr:hypothetical protein [Candidatus Lokiarchaeota archaeon]
MTRIQKKIGATGEKILVYCINGRSMADLVDLMLEQYSSRDTCWAAISRTVKRLASLDLIEDKEKERFNFIKTTSKGRLLVQEKIPLELISDDRIKFLIQEMKSRELDLDKLKELILEILSKFGRQTANDLSKFLQISSDIIVKVLNEMDDKLKKEVIIVNEKEETYYFINWKLIFSPIKKILR